MFKTYEKQENLNLKNLDGIFLNFSFMNDFEK